jgi:hypothetical protein
MVKEMPCAGREEPNPMTRQILCATHLVAAGSSIALLALGDACSGSSSGLGASDAVAIDSSVISCGPGTVLVHGQCVVADASRQSESAADASGQDVPIADGGAGEGSPSDAPSYSSDPCPGASLPPLMLDCTGACVPDGSSLGPNSYSCEYACDPASSASFVPPATVRPPSEPWPGCSQLCPPGVGRVTAALFLRGYVDNTTRVVRVSPPWKITDYASYTGPTGQYESCPTLPDANLTASTCVVVQPHDVLFSIWTDDPNPPARNVTIEPYPPGCP